MVAPRHPPRDQKPEKKTNMKPVSQEQTTINRDYSINLLVLAVIGEAKRSAEHGNSEALRWIRTEGALWFEAIGRDRNELLQLADGIQPKRRKKPAKHQWKRTAAPTMQEAC
jgi:hypothetical protein